MLPSSITATTCISTKQPNVVTEWIPPVGYWNTDITPQRRNAHLERYRFSSTMTVRSLRRPSYGNGKANSISSTPILSISTPIRQYGSTISTTHTTSRICACTSSPPGYNDYPVIGVSWEQANAFCVWRTNLLHLTPTAWQNLIVCRPRPNEYAARAGKSEKLCHPGTTTVRPAIKGASMPTSNR